ncbi:MAG TPA: SRPBCC family protein [Thermoanaerobaculia bacterium]|nr:SRPBCC family protein [Thermoanaerobaculia bacterium]
MPRPFIGLALGLLAAVSAAGADAPKPLSATDRARLEKGEILLGSIEIPGTSFKEGVGRALIPQPIERVERAVADVLHYEEFMPFLESSTAEPQADGSILSRQRLDLPGLLGTRRLTARFRLARPTPSTYSVTWISLPGGEVRDQHGSFALEPLGTGTLVTCRFFLDTGGSPAFLVNPQTERSVGWILDGLRQHVNRGRYAGK